jgi:hypothetical protein
MQSTRRIPALLSLTVASLSTGQPAERSSPEPQDRPANEPLALQDLNTILLTSPRERLATSGSAAATLVDGLSLRSIWGPESTSRLMHSTYEQITILRRAEDSVQQLKQLLFSKYSQDQPDTHSSVIKKLSLSLIARVQEWDGALMGRDLEGSVDSRLLDRLPPELPRSITGILQRLAEVDADLDADKSLRDCAEVLLAAASSVLPSLAQGGPVTYAQTLEALSRLVRGVESRSPDFPTRRPSHWSRLQRDLSFLSLPGDNFPRHGIVHTWADAEAVTASIRPFLNDAERLVSWSTEGGLSPIPIEDLHPSTRWWLVRSSLVNEVPRDEWPADRPEAEKAMRHAAEVYAHQRSSAYLTLRAETKDRPEAAPVRIRDYLTKYPEGPANPKFTIAARKGIISTLRSSSSYPTIVVSGPHAQERRNQRITLALDCMALAPQSWSISETLLAENTPVDRVLRNTLWDLVDGNQP